MSKEEGWLNGVDAAYYLLEKLADVDTAREAVFVAQEVTLLVEEARELLAAREKE